MPDEHIALRNGNKGCFLPQLGTFEALALKGTKLNDDNLTLDDDFHLATMMGVWLVFFLPQLGTFEALALKGTRLNDDNLTLDEHFHFATMMGVWLVSVSG